MTKYPGAETMPERLQEILDSYFYDGKDGPLLLNPSNGDSKAVRDLLEMIEERDVTIAQLSDEIAIEGGIKPAKSPG